MRAIAMGLALALLAGCSGEGRVRGGGAGLPEVAMRNNEAAVVPPGRVTTALALRTFVPAGPDAWNEVTGARCTVTGGDYFGAVVVTPVRLRVQDLGPDAPPIRADCTSGALKGSAAVAPGFSWPVEGRPSPVHRVWWGAGWWWGFQKTGPMRYGDLAVALR